MHKIVVRIEMTEQVRIVREFESIDQDEFRKRIEKRLAVAERISDMRMNGRSTDVHGELPCWS